MYGLFVIIFFIVMVGTFFIQYKDIGVTCFAILLPLWVVIVLLTLIISSEDWYNIGEFKYNHSINYNIISLKYENNIKESFVLGCGDKKYSVYQHVDLSDCYKIQYYDVNNTLICEDVTDSTAFVEHVYTKVFRTFWQKFFMFNIRDEIFLEKYILHIPKGSIVKQFNL